MWYRFFLVSSCFLNLVKFYMFYMLDVIPGCDGQVGEGEREPLHLLGELLIHCDQVSWGLSLFSPS